MSDCASQHKPIRRCSAHNKNGKLCKNKTSYFAEIDSEDSGKVMYLCHVHREKEHDICNICFDPICKKLYATECNHHFHIDCIVPWLHKKNTCPVCRCVLAQNLLITIGMYRNCARKMNKGIICEFWVETKHFSNHTQLEELFCRYLKRHPKSESVHAKLTRQVFYVKVNSIGNQNTPMSFKYLPDHVLNTLIGKDKNQKMNMLVNILYQLADKGAVYKH